jgi:AcrR family transcriptional regulator
LFATQGYSRTTTREIAEHAGVLEALLFRHFGTKANLFEQAVLEPFAEFVDTFVDEWRRRLATGEEPTDLGRAYLEGIYQLFQENRGILFATVNAHFYEPELVAATTSGESPLAAILGRVEALGAEIDTLSFEHVDIDIATRLTFASVVGTVLLDEWLFPQGTRPSDPILVKELSAFLYFGLRPEGAGGYERDVSAR